MVSAAPPAGNTGDPGVAPGRAGTYLWTREEVAKGPCARGIAMLAEVPATLSRVLIGSDPWLTPAVLLLCGLTASLVLGREHRRSRGWRRAVVVATYGLVVSFAFAAAGTMVAHRLTLFWGAHYEDDGRTLVLERLVPLPDVRLPVDEVAAITEFAVPEHSLRGPRRSVRFRVQARDGRAWWSAPIYLRSRADRARRVLIAATDNRLERFLMGTAELP